MTDGVDGGLAGGGAWPGFRQRQCWDLQSAAHNTPLKCSLGLFEGGKVLEHIGQGREGGWMADGMDLSNIGSIEPRGLDERTLHWT